MQRSNKIKWLVLVIVLALLFYAGAYVWINGCFINGNLFLPSQASVEKMLSDANENSNIHGIKCVYFGPAVSRIPKACFKDNSSLEFVYFCNGVSFIEEYAFCNCSSLAAVKWPEHLKSIGESSFSHTGLRTVVLPKEVTSVGLWAFQFMPALEEAVIPGSLRSITYNFNDCPLLHDVTIESGLTELGDFMFEDDPLLKTVHLPDSVTVLGESCFYRSGLEELFIEGQIYSISDFCVNEYKYPNLKAIYFLQGPPTVDQSKEGTGASDTRPPMGLFSTGNTECVIYYTAEYAGKWLSVIKDGKWNGFATVQMP